MTRTCRILTVGLIVMLGQAGTGRTASADAAGFARCWSGIRSSSTRSLRRTRRTPPVSGSGRSFTRRSSMRTTASNGATRQSSFTTSAPRGASRRAAVIAAAYTALVGLFPSQQAALDASYAASLAALSDDGEDGGQSRERGIDWGTRGRAGRARLARDRWVQRELPSVHRWDGGRPVAADTARVRSDERPGVGIHRRRSSWSATPSSGLDHREVWTSATYADDFNAVKALGRKTGSTRTDGPDGARAVLGGQRQRPLESGRQPDCARQPPVDVRQQPAARGPEHRDGRHGVHHLERQAILRRRFRAK